MQLPFQYPPWTGRRFLWTRAKGKLSLPTDAIESISWETPLLGGHGMFTELSILFLCLLIGIALTMRYTVRKMISSPEAREEPNSVAEITASLPDGFRALLDSEGFRFTKAYSFHVSRFGIWIRISPDPPLRFFYLSRQGTVCEFITTFSDEISLTTTTTRAAFVFPRPFGSFLQSFPKAKPHDLWRAHLQGEDYLTSKLEVRVEECQLPFLDGFKRDVIRKLSYVTSRRWWFVRGVYWYLIKRFLLHNRPIWNQDVSELYGKAA
jgi:hypothetical protein